MADVEFYWDPICPFAWVTSRWVSIVAERRNLSVDWRFICLRVINEGRDYEADFPPGYLDLHTRGQRMLRVAAAARGAHGDQAMGALYTAFGESIWNRTRLPGAGAFDGIGDHDHLVRALGQAGLTTELARAADDAAHDDVLRADTAMALERAGGGIGTPVVVTDPPDGPGFFGPVISRVPGPDEAERLWDAVTVLSRWPGFAELKRSLREHPQLPLLQPPT